jgi:hypothetical protein
MHKPDTPSPPDARTPFWALLLLLATLTFLQVAYLIDDINERNRILAARSQMKAVLDNAIVITQTTDAVGRELVARSSQSPEAAKIVTEFNLKLNKPANAPR